MLIADYAVLARELAPLRLDLPGTGLGWVGYGPAVAGMTGWRHRKRPLCATAL